MSRPGTVLAFVAVLAQGCCSRPAAPDPPDLVERVRDKAAVSFDVWLGDDDETADAMRGLRTRRPEPRTWSDLLMAWASRPALAEAFDPDQKVRARLEDDDGWVEAAKEAYPPDGEVPDAIYVEGFLEAVDDWLGEH